REVSLEASASEMTIHAEGRINPEQEALLADSVGLALLVVLDMLSPAERLAFVLHDIFAVPFDEIAPIVERTPAAARQLASRARRRVRAGAWEASADLRSQREVVEAFLSASRAGNFDALISVLDPNVVFRDNQRAVAASAPSEVRGAQAIAKQFMGGAQVARPVLVNGSVGIVVAPHGRLLLVGTFVIRHGKIAEIEAISDLARLRQLDLALLPD